ncbi:MAG TPA: GNAT family N-acetyltransferase [Rhizomicrobium sp.]|nr:GNAT family N-acetyltransferase [Rhizomicrobium sp.]
MTIAIRPCASADMAALTDIWFDSWASTGVSVPSPATRMELRDRLPREVAGGWEVLVVTVDGVPAGFMALAGDLLEQLFIAPAFQNRGLGKCLLDRAKRMRPKGLRLTTAVDSGACRFYLREGLAVVAPDDVHPRFGHARRHFSWTP